MARGLATQTAPAQPPPPEPQITREVFSVLETAPGIRRRIC